jgi:Argonaute siRNA chaperone (ARC) complex subunit Arb1
MADSHKHTQHTEDYGYAVPGNEASRVEFTGADELKARLAASDADNENTAESNARVNVDEVAPIKKKPKVKQPKPTGFEDYHADAPLTPAEHAEEQELYDRYLCLDTKPVYHFC